MTDNRKTTLIRLSPEALDAITERAREREISRNEWMARALDYVLAKQTATRIIVTTEIVL